MSGMSLTKIIKRSGPRMLTCERDIQVHSQKGYQALLLSKGVN